MCHELDGLYAAAAAESLRSRFPGKSNRLLGHFSNSFGRNFEPFVEDFVRLGRRRIGLKSWRLSITTELIFFTWGQFYKTFWLPSITAGKKVIVWRKFILIQSIFVDHVRKEN